MKLIHLSDLHIGKRLYDFPLFEDQRYIFAQVYDCIRSNHIDAVLIAGDIYDKSQPTAEAVALFNELLEQLSALGKPVLIISGNHDSIERVSCGARLMEKGGVYIARCLEDSLKPVTLTDEYGEINIYMLPFLRPSDVNNTYEQSFSDTEGAVAYMIEKMHVDPSKRNIIMSHQTIAGVLHHDPEMAIGGSECVPASLYDRVFDYTAMGHIHRRQSLGNGTVHYCGTLLRYAIDESAQTKTMTVLTLAEKGSEPQLDFLPLHPLRNIRKVEGGFHEILENHVSEKTDDYVYVVLTDDFEADSAAQQLRSLFPRLINVSYKRADMEHDALLDDARPVFNDKRSPLELFEDFYSAMHGRGLTDYQRELMQDIVRKVWEGEE